MAQTIQKTITINHVNVLVLARQENGEFKQVRGYVEIIGNYSDRKLRKAVGEKYQARQYIVEGISTKQNVYVMDKIKFMANAKLIKTIEK